MKLESLVQNLQDLVKSLYKHELDVEDAKYLIMVIYLIFVTFNSICYYYYYFFLFFLFFIYISKK